jgi:hypothetical protein
MISFLLSVQATADICPDAVLLGGTAAAAACICRVPAGASEAVVADVTCAIGKFCSVTYHYDANLLPVWRAECLDLALSQAGGTPAVAGKNCLGDGKKNTAKCHCDGPNVKINDLPTINLSDITKYANVCQKDEYCYATAFTGGKKACFKNAEICPSVDGSSKLKKACQCAKGKEGGPLSKKDVTTNVPQVGVECKVDQYCTVGDTIITDELKGFTLSESSESQSRHDKAAADAKLLGLELGKKQWTSCDATQAKVCPDRTGTTLVAERCKCIAETCGKVTLSTTRFTLFCFHYSMNFTIFLGLLLHGLLGAFSR